MELVPQELPAKLPCRQAAGRQSRGAAIWSAACSTGDEPYTIACSIAASLPNWKQWKVRVLGTDIGLGALEQCRQATFSERADAAGARGFQEPLFHQASRGAAVEGQAAAHRNWSASASTTC